jgi:hypothetical protein
MNKKVTSFIGEHTAEFALVPEFKLILHQKYKYVTPIFPWMSREGSNISVYIHKDDKFKIVGLYPRRPKINPQLKNTIFVKINSKIIYGAKYGKEIGLPIIAGCPLAQNLMQLGQTPKCLWINLDIKQAVTKELRINFCKNRNICNELDKIVFKTEEKIHKYISETVKTFDIGRALEAFRNIKSVSTEGMIGAYGLSYMGGYKPVYFLLK